MTDESPGAEPHHHAVRVYYEDTDAGGIVYYANYLRYAERARSELLRDAGFENRDLLESRGIALAVRRAEATYLKPARLDDALLIKTAITEIKGASVDMRQVVSRDAEQLVIMEVTLVCLKTDGPQTGRPTRWPDDITSAMREWRI